jgi:hypothetical protein
LIGSWAPIVIALDRINATADRYNFLLTEILPTPIQESHVPDICSFRRVYQAVAEVEAKQVREIVEAGLSSYGAGRTSPQAAVAQRVRARCRKK